jgi:hypothetical protein
MASSFLPLLTIAALSLAAHSSRAAMPLSAGGGFDYYSGPGNQIDRSVLATVGAGLGPTGNVALTALHYDDSRIGNGKGAIVGIGLPLIPSTSLHAWGARFVGDGSFRAWRVKAGPQVGLPMHVNGGIYYLHYEDNLGDQSNGAIAELGVPLVSGLSGRASVSLATVPNDLKSTEGMVGLSWSPIHSLELSGDVGLARNGAVGAAPASTLPLGLPLLGDGGSSGGSPSVESRTESTFLLGVRVTLP